MPVGPSREQRANRGRGDRLRRDRLHGRWRRPASLSSGRGRLARARSFHIRRRAPAAARFAAATPGRVTTTMWASVEDLAPAMPGAAGPRRRRRRRAAPAAAAASSARSSSSVSPCNSCRRARSRACRPRARELRHRQLEHREPVRGGGRRRRRDAADRRAGTRRTSARVERVAHFVARARRCP